MGILELLLIALGLSMDAFAIAVCQGLAMKKISWKNTLIVGLYFGIFQALMPLIGYIVGSQFSSVIERFDHWIAFVLLAFIGTNMIIGSFKKEDCPDEVCIDRECLVGKRPDTEEVSLKSSKMLPLALATSIDALAVGVSFAFLHVRIIPAVSSIGIITLALSIIGVKIGNVFGVKFKSIAELVGGGVLILMGLKILLEHTGFLNL